MSIPKGKENKRELANQRLFQHPTNALLSAQTLTLSCLPASLTLPCMHSPCQRSRSQSQFHLTLQRDTPAPGDPGITISTPISPCAPTLVPAGAVSTTQGNARMLVEET